MLLASEAAARGDLEALRASPSTITKTLGHLPLLHLAAEGSFLSIVDFLVAERGCAVDARSSDGTTALHGACGRFGGDRVAGYLLSVGADPGALDEDGWTPLHYASRYSGDARTRVKMNCSCGLW